MRINFKVIKYAILLLFILMFVSLNFTRKKYFTEENRENSNKLPEEWLTCTDSSDCLIIEGVCGRWIPVNKSSETKARKWAHSINIKVFCEHISEPKPFALCRKGLCDY